MPQDTTLPKEPYDMTVLAALSFFRSVIKNEESWTPTCEKIYLETTEKVRNGRFE